MVFYSGTRYTTEQVGEMVVQVVCDRCKCEYYYVLARVGVGHETAPYGIGSDHARRSAAKNSSTDLEQRLATEAELVPCPKCHWINDAMIEGYRRSYFRFLGNWAIAIAIGGTTVSLIVAWFYLSGHAKEREHAGFYLYYGPVLSSLLGGSMLVLRNSLRNCIVPNRHMPSGMRLPEGSPPALLKDPSSGKLLPAGTSPQGNPLVDSTWSFPLAHLNFPPVCCGCLRQLTSDQFNYECELSAAMTVDIPRCGNCAGSDYQRRRTILTGMVISFQLVSAIAISIAAPRNDFWFYNAIAFFIGGAISYYTTKLFGGPVRVLDNDRSRGYVKLRFRNAEFGKIVSDHIGQTY